LRPGVRFPSVRRARSFFGFQWRGASYPTGPTTETRQPSPIAPSFSRPNPRNLGQRGPVKVYRCDRFAVENRPILQSGFSFDPTQPPARTFPRHRSSDPQTVGRKSLPGPARLTISVGLQPGPVPGRSVAPARRDEIDADCYARRAVRCIYATVPQPAQARAHSRRRDGKPVGSPRSAISFRPVRRPASFPGDRLLDAGLGVPNADERPHAPNLRPVHRGS